MVAEPQPPHPTHFGEPEKPSRLKWLLFAAFVIFALCGIFCMIVNNPRQHGLICSDYDGSGLWNAIGRCTEDQ